MNRRNQRTYGRALQALVVASYRRAARRASLEARDTTPAARKHLSLEYQLLVGRVQDSLSEAREDALLEKMGDLWWHMTDAECNAANRRASLETRAGNLTDHANYELKKAGLFDKDADYGGALGKAVLELVKLFAKQGHSGGSAFITREVFNKLANFKPLTPITSDPEEWNDVSYMGGADGSSPLWQNKRCPSTFSKDGGKTWYDIEEQGAKAVGENEPVYDPGFDGFIGVMDPNIEEKRRRWRERKRKMKPTKKTLARRITKLNRRGAIAKPAKTTPKAVMSELEAVVKQTTKLKRFLAVIEAKKAGLATTDELRLGDMAESIMQAHEGLLDAIYAAQRLAKDLK